jgi:hypothetical protein
MAPSAFIELGLAVDLFEKGAQHSRRARNGLGILRKLREKASMVYSGKIATAVDLPQGSRYDDSEDELAIFGGQTRVLITTLTSGRKNRKYSPSAASESVPNSPIPDVHPSVMEFLSFFPQSIQKSQHGSSDISTQSPIQSHSSPTTWQPHPLAFPPVTQTYDGAYINYFPESQSEPSPPGIPIEPNHQMDFGMMVSGESGMDEGWISFIRDSGLLDGSSRPSAP